MADNNLDLDVDFVGHDESREEVARVCVASACRFTRSGGAPTITADCTDLRTLEGEIARLKRELDAVAEKARQHFGEVQPKPKQAVSSSRPSAGEALAPRERLVREVMTKDVQTLGRNDEVSMASELMKVGHFRHVVVLDEEKHVAGVISRQDIHYGALAWAMGLSESMHEKSLHSTSAKAIMRNEVISTAPEATLQEAAQLMITNKIGCLPVLDGMQLVGIVTEGDLLALLGS